MNSLSKIVLVLLLAVATMATASATAAEKTILVLGDSLSAGFGIPRERSWPSLLEQRLQSDHAAYRVANLSISGETTAGGMSRLPEALRQYRPAVVVIALGANDGLRGLPLEAMRANLDTMIGASQEAGARVVLVGMRLPPNFGPAYVSRFAATFSELSRRRKTPLVPFLLDGFADRPEAFQADGLHPTAAFQPAILDNIWPALKPLLR